VEAATPQAGDLTAARAAREAVCRRALHGAGGRPGAHAYGPSDDVEVRLAADSFVGLSTGCSPLSLRLR
jgi:hypothetical protein